MLEARERVRAGFCVGLGETFFARQENQKLIQVGRGFRGQKGKGNGCGCGMVWREKERRPWVCFSRRGKGIRQQRHSSVTGWSTTWETLYCSSLPATKLAPHFEPSSVSTQFFTTPNSAQPFFLLTPTVRPRRPVVLLCCPRTRSPQ